MWLGRFYHCRLHRIICVFRLRHSCRILQKKCSSQVHYFYHILLHAPNAHDVAFGSFHCYARHNRYTGGQKKNPTYQNIMDATEAFMVEFDPSVITYEEILDEVSAGFTSEN